MGRKWTDEEKEKKRLDMIEYHKTHKLGFRNIEYKQSEDYKSYQREYQKLYRLEHPNYYKEIQRKLYRMKKEKEEEN